MKTVIGDRSSGDQRAFARGFLVDLRHQTLPRFFVGAPSEQTRTVPESSSGKVIVLNLDHKLRLQRLPLR